MKKTIFVKALFVIALFSVCGSASAQGFLKKLGKAAKKMAENTTEVATTTDNSTPSLASALTTNADGSQTFSWDSIPQYHAEKVYLTDEQGNKINNTDGTPSYRVFLVDQFGNKRSKSAVEAQHKRIKAQIGQIWAKVGTGAAAGALGGILGGGGLKGAVTGAAGGALTGVFASLGNISNIKKERKSLKQQEKLLEAYAKNFTDEGTPIDASVDPDKIGDLELKSDNTLTMTAAEVKEELASSDFSNADNSIFDDLDSVLGAAEKDEKKS